MTSLSEMHDRAMVLAEEAEAAKGQKRYEDAQRLVTEAMKLERDAAMVLLSSFGEEPTRSVLFRSAAALAVDAGLPRDAEQLIALALGGSPPDEIAKELRDLMDHVNFSRHLDLIGIELEPEEVQMSIAGSGVDHGMASSDDFIGRVKVFEKWLKQVAHQKAALLDWTEDRVASLKRSLGVYLSIPRPASFAVSMRVGKPSAQQHLRFDSFESGLIDEILDEIEAVNSGREDELFSRMGEEAARDAIGFAKALAPTSEGVDLVGFTVIRNGSQRRVAFRRPKREIRVPRPGSTTTDNAIRVLPVSAEQGIPIVTSGLVPKDSQFVRVTGHLKFADATGSQPVVKLVTAEGLFHNIIVSSVLVDAVVKPYWSEEVVITGHATPDGIVFDGIERAQGG